MGWRHILVSRNYGSTEKELRESIAWQEILQHVKLKDGPTDIEAYLSYRLIPLDKLPDVRTTGIGEILRRIVGKTVVATVKAQVVRSAGPQQLCAGRETAAHAMMHVFLQDDTDARYRFFLLMQEMPSIQSIERYCCTKCQKRLKCQKITVEGREYLAWRFYWFNRWTD